MNLVSGLSAPIAKLLRGMQTSKNWRVTRQKGKNLRVTSEKQLKDMRGVWIYENKIVTGSFYFKGWFFF